MHRRSARGGLRAVDTALAVALGNTSLFVPLLVIGPLVAAALASPRCTLGVALLAVACAHPAGARRRTASSRPSTSARWRPSPPAASLAVLAAKGRRSYEEALVNERAARRRSDFVAGRASCSTRHPSPRRCCARSCGWPSRTWPSCASSTSCTTARSARRPPTRPIRARSRCCTSRACATRSTPRGRTPSPSRAHGPPAPAARDRGRAAARVRRRRAST